MNNKWGDVKFLHYRAYKEDDVGLVSVDPNSGCTIAYVMQYDGTIRWATAQCAAVDRYNKAYGRQKASGRLLSQRLNMAIVLPLHEWLIVMDSQAEDAGFYRRKRGGV